MKKAFIFSADYLDCMDFSVLQNEVLNQVQCKDMPFIFVLGSCNQPYEPTTIINILGRGFASRDYRSIDLIELGLTSVLNLEIISLMLYSYGYNSFISFNDDIINSFLFEDGDKVNKVDDCKGDSFTCYSITEEVNLNSVIDIIKNDKLNYIQLNEVSKILSYIKVEPDTKKILYIDISTLIHFDHATGIQRVVKELAKQIMSFNLSYDCKLIYSYPKHEHFYEADLLEYTYKTQSSASIEKHMIDFFDGDKILFLDLHPSNAYTKKDIIKSLQLRGVESYFIVYDLLPISHPHCFVQELVDDFKSWLETVVCSNGAICISNDVKNKLEQWISTSGTYKYPHFWNEYFHLGADFSVSTIKSNDKPSQASLLEKYIINESYNVYLMVGTVEPRKGHVDVLDAFELMWRESSSDILVIVGKAGWRNKELIKRLETHSMLGVRLFWLQGLSDGYLDYLYQNSTCLISASEGEGFGLPLIESAQYGLPIISRDIPVFKEVAGDFAYYFQNGKLHEAIIDWKNLHKNNSHPKSEGMKYLSWKESADSLLSHIISR
ncbi:hypothetical protein C1N32_12950 [Vibrio diazotrophicus]|uniref:Glycosyl transferase family 1 domain-containing protein n=1 Tax=Vibrio diazotrophicus TaxID=685 RepID=A0A2J8I1G4_VIBDI|nr:MULTISPECIES: glycosyltransferase family 1 protein [Vibrio]MCF7363437.1 glycosyltransferase family 4 protein [Vibrio sp. A1-b2]PNI04334.1 hypothetical protein C1N32_12950 [Vibrio diazotrophicus]